MRKELKMSEEQTTPKKDPRVEEVRQHMKAAREAWKKSMEEILPPGFREHRRVARREMLLAFRSMLDAAIEHTEKK
jgi:type VI protein secretion system component VasK